MTIPLKELLKFGRIFKGSEVTLRDLERKWDAKGDVVRKKGDWMAKVTLFLL
jgi:hypothetical protein